MNNKTSKWYKQIGGDFGCVKLKNKWVWYDCLHCARHMYPHLFATPRWQGPPSNAIINATNLKAVSRIACQGPEMHKEIWQLKNAREKSNGNL